LATLAEQGLADFNISLWFGMWAPAGTPPAVVQKLNAMVNGALQMPDVKEQFAKLGITPNPMKPDEFGRFVRDEIATYQKVVKLANIQPQ
jgi:tripartite-type tricarboxylate transporter receptor subunit TctC